MMVGACGWLDGTRRLRLAVRVEPVEGADADIQLVVQHVLQLMSDLVLVIEIVIVQKGDVLAPGQLDAPVARRGDADIGGVRRVADVGPKKGRDLLVRRQLVGRAFAVVVDQYRLDPGMRLSDDAAQCRFDEVGSPMHGNDNGDKRHVGHRESGSVMSV
jgi:hypothetical protein